MAILSKAVEWALQGAEQSCEACGSTFTCGPFLKGGCWCMREKVSAETRAALKAQYKRCLCPDCLRRAEAGQGSA
ncbi:MAG: cysteine-rich CWC family protein [Bryobacterales bacterium]|nr:cysteine-rich CWC family protein [Bryobacterales bacterium]